MNITVNRAELLSAVRRMASIAPSESPLDVLRGVLLETDAANGKLILTATNMEQALMERLPCTVAEDGALVVGAQLLFGMVEKLAGETVEITRKEQQSTVSLRSGDAGYTVPIWSRSSFPKPEIPFPEDTVKVSGIPNMAKRTIFAVSGDSTKPMLRCVNLMFTQNGLRTAGSDGTCVVTAKGDEKSTGNINLLIPATSLEKLARIVRDEDELRVGTTGKHIVFFKENFLFSARLMEGGYIDTNQLISYLQNSFTVLTDVTDLKEGLNTVLCVGADSKVSMTFEGGQLTFRCEGTHANAETSIEVIPMTGTPKGEYWYSARRLMACLRALTGTLTLGIAQNGMLTLSAQDAFYMQNAMRPSAVKAEKKKPSAKAA